jgi:hypothetical protein
MIKYALPAAVAVIALTAPVIAQAQIMQPTPQFPPSNNNLTNANATIAGQVQPAPGEYTDQALVQPMAQPPMAVQPAAPGQYLQPMPGTVVQPISPRTTWIPGHYNWDPNTSNYVWTDGQYVEAPTASAQWTPGHWVQTPSAWIWVNGGWH